MKGERVIASCSRGKTEWLTEDFVKKKQKKKHVAYYTISQSTYLNMKLLHFPVFCTLS